MIIFENANVRFKFNYLIKNLNLKLYPGEICILLGSNGIGKTSFVKAISGNNQYFLSSKGGYYNVCWGSFDEITAAKLGIFLAFQHPAEISGIIYIHFLKLIADKANKNKNFSVKIIKVLNVLKVNHNLLYRPVNIGFSGGEKRLFELIQMIILEPKLCILDEPDSGLDYKRFISIIKLILGFNSSNRTFLIITHNYKLLLELSPDSIYYLIDNKLLSLRKKIYIR